MMLKTHYIVTYQLEGGAKGSFTMVKWFLASPSDAYLAASKKIRDDLSTGLGFVITSMNRI